MNPGVSTCLVFLSLNILSVYHQIVLLLQCFFFGEFRVRPQHSSYIFLHMGLGYIFHALVSYFFILHVLSCSSRFVNSDYIFIMCMPSFLSINYFNPCPLCLKCFFHVFVFFYFFSQLTEQPFCSFFITFILPAILGPILRFMLII